MISDDIWRSSSKTRDVYSRVNALGGKLESHNLDVLRTVAVGLVFGRHLVGRLFSEDVAHYAGELQLLGVLGVWFFFVHTSLVLMFSLEKQALSFRWPHLYFSFIVRRAFRIFPLSIVTIAIVYGLAATWAHNPIVPLSELSGPTVLANLFLAQNLFDLPDVIGPLWTLPIEFQMYLFLPPLWVLGTRLGWTIMAFGVWPLAVLGALLASRASAAPWSGVLLYAPCFIPGILSYLLWRRVNWRFSSLVLPILLGVLIVVYLVLGRVSQTGGAWAVCLLLGCVLPWVGDIKSPVLNRVCGTLAKYSYGIYLFHEVCIPITQEMLGKDCNSIVIAVVSILSTAFFAVLGYHAVEAPLIRWGLQISAMLFHRRRLAYIG